MIVQKGDLIDFVEATLSFGGDWGVCIHYKAKVLHDTHPSGLVTVQESVNNQIIRITDRQIIKKYKKRAK